MMTDQDREWPLPPVVYRGSAQIDGEVQVEDDFLGRGETPLPAPFVATGFPAPDAIRVDALPTVAAGSMMEPEEPEEPEADSWPETFRDAEAPLERHQEVTSEYDPLATAGPLDMEASLPALEAEVADEQVEDEEVVEVMGRSEELEVAPEATLPLTSYSAVAMPPSGLGAETEESRPAPSPPQEDVAILLERLAAEVRARGEMRLDGGSVATPLEGLLRGVLAGYLAHVEKGPG
ncbi:MAG: hypothetical protein EA421_13080 [Gemmatimonadales bacterium]|nr:MAG: hypothetical protein EA421_13080 [Gemmatimonadales bacterium]